MISFIFFALCCFQGTNGLTTDPRHPGDQTQGTTAGTAHDSDMLYQDDMWEFITCTTGSDQFINNDYLGHVAYATNHQKLHGTSINIDARDRPCSSVADKLICQGAYAGSIWLDSGEYFDQNRLTSASSKQDHYMYWLLTLSTEIILKDVVFLNRQLQPNIHCKLPTEIEITDSTRQDADGNWHIDNWGLDYNYIGNEFWWGKFGDDGTCCNPAPDTECAPPPAPAPCFPLKKLHLENVAMEGSINKLLASDGNGLRAFALTNLTLKDTRMTGSLSDVMMGSRVDRGVWSTKPEGWTGLEDLVHLDLSNVGRSEDAAINGLGRFTGTIPLEWGSALSKIKYLSLAGNDIDGFEEGWDWSWWESLEHLDLSENEDMTGSIVDMMDKLPNLKVLILHKTKLQMVSLEELHHAFPKLERVSLTVVDGEFQLPASITEIEVHGYRDYRKQNLDWECVAFSSPGIPLRCSSRPDSVDCPSTDGVTCNLDMMESANYFLTAHPDFSHEGFLNCYSNIKRMPILRYSEVVLPSKVKIVIPGESKTLSVAELRVYAVEGGDNIALGRTTSQAATTNLVNHACCVSESAVDDDLATFTHPVGTDPSVTVELDEFYNTVFKVELVNRVGGPWERLNGVQIWLDDYMCGEIEDANGAGPFVVSCADAPLTSGVMGALPTECDSSSKCVAWEGPCDNDGECKDELVCSDPISPYDVPRYFQIYGTSISAENLFGGNSHRFCIPAWLLDPGDDNNFHTIPCKNNEGDTNLFNHAKIGGEITTCDALNCEWKEKARVWCPEIEDGTQNDDRCVQGSSSDNSIIKYVQIEDTMMGGDVFNSLNLLGGGDGDRAQVLETLILKNNDFKGDLRDFTYQRFPKLKKLILKNNRITGDKADTNHLCSPTKINELNTQNQITITIKRPPRHYCLSADNEFITDQPGATTCANQDWEFTVWINDKKLKNFVSSSESVTLANVDVTPQFSGTCGDATDMLTGELYTHCKGTVDTWSLTFTVVGMKLDQLEGLAIQSNNPHLLYGTEIHVNDALRATITTADHRFRNDDNGETVLTTPTMLPMNAYRFVTCDIEEPLVYDRDLRPEEYAQKTMLQYHGLKYYVGSETDRQNHNARHFWEDEVLSVGHEHPGSGAVLMQFYIKSWDYIIPVPSNDYDKLSLTYKNTNVVECELLCGKTNGCGGFVHHTMAGGTCALMRTGFIDYTNPGPQYRNKGEILEGWDEQAPPITFVEQNFGFPAPENKLTEQQCKGFVNHMGWNPERVPGGYVDDFNSLTYPPGCFTLISDGKPGTVEPWGKVYYNHHTQANRECGVPNAGMIPTCIVKLGQEILPYQDFAIYQIREYQEIPFRPDTTAFSDSVEVLEEGSTSETCLLRCKNKCHGYSYQTSTRMCYLFDYNAYDDILNGNGNLENVASDWLHAVSVPTRTPMNMALTPASDDLEFHWRDYKILEPNDDPVEEMTNVFNQIWTCPQDQTLDEFGQYHAYCNGVKSTAVYPAYENCAFAVQSTEYLHGKSCETNADGTRIDAPLKVRFTTDHDDKVAWLALKCKEGCDNEALCTAWNFCYPYGTEECSNLCTLFSAEKPSFPSIVTETVSETIRYAGRKIYSEFYKTPLGLCVDCVTSGFPEPDTDGNGMPDDCDCGFCGSILERCDETCVNNHPQVTPCIGSSATTDPPTDPPTVPPTDPPTDPPEPCEDKWAFCEVSANTASAGNQCGTSEWWATWGCKKFCGNCPTTGADGSPCPYTFTENAAIPGENTETHTSVSVEECKSACCAATTFVCASFDYEPLENRCWLSNKHASNVGGLKTDYPGNPYDHYDRCADVNDCPALYIPHT